MPAEQAARQLGDILEVRGGNCEPILIPLSRRRERKIDDHSTSRANHYFRREHLVIN